MRMLDLLEEAIVTDLDAFAAYVEGGPIGPEGPGSRNAIDVHAWRLRKLFAFCRHGGQRLMLHALRKREDALTLLEGFPDVEGAKRDARFLLEEARLLDARAILLFDEALDIARELAAHERGEGVT